MDELFGNLNGELTMKLREFPFFSSELVQFACDDLTSAWQVGESVSVQADGDNYLIRQGDFVCLGKVIGHQDRTALQVQRGLTLWVLRNRHEKVLLLQSLDLVEHVQLDMVISVDEAIAEQLASRGDISAPDVEAAVGWLRDQFIAADAHPTSEMGRIFLGRFDNASDKGFVLFGASWRGTVKRDGGVLRLMSVTLLRGTTARLAMVIGKISFQDASVAVRMQSTEQKSLLDAALRDNGSYLQLWQEYGALEWEQARDRAKELGSLRFKNADLIEGEYWTWFLKVDVDQLKDFRKRWKALGLPSTTQVELGENELDLDSEVDDAPGKAGWAQRRPVRGELQFKNDGVVLILPQDRRAERPPEKGFIYYSLAGDENVLKNRARARQSIKDGRRLPQLSYLLEEVHLPSTRRRQLVGLSPYAKACFKGPPTAKQKQALDVAINTPDIALIVGPPGTGKTQVIAALQRRLAETLEGNSLQHQVLISSYQHDAVDNALNRAEVYGLPAVRIGGRGRRDEGGVDPVRIWCERKRKEIAVRLDKIQQNEPLTQPLEELDLQITALRLAKYSPSERYLKFKKVDEILRQLNILNLRLPAQIRDRWNEFLNKQSMVETQSQANEPAELLRLIRALRTSPIGFADDGTNRIYHLERTLRRGCVKLEESEWRLLQRLSTVADATETDLSDLAVFKMSMLNRLIPDYRPAQLKQSLSGETLGLLADIEHAIDIPLRQSRRGISAVVASYHAALAQDPDEAARAVQEYASIVGATCQQSAGKAMSNLKDLSDLEASEGIEFDTVVIDEAARANPLDLFVPMAMARRRIILVGDHRQLPHLVQRELEDELISRQSLTEAEAKAYEQSLFERLVKQLREQEKVDNIKRVVMLDTQYRMHPTLGDFISKQFYESEGLEVLHSGRPAQDFAHAIPGYQGKCAAWFDVPLQEGKEDRRGSSRIRQAEASAIAKEVKRIADTCGPTLSIGVISFYRAQCDLILEALVDQGLAEEEDGEIQISRSYRQTESGDERLRVGTVDGFQGKEFDVVFLSIVRANDVVVPDQKEEKERERLLNGKYGHLRLANRLNVAMSRQRKLLVAVGDKRMVEGSLSEEAVPALTAFLKLCRKEHANGR
jgi:hypothetical protein